MFACLLGAPDVVICVDTHPTSNMIVSGSLEKDKVVCIWVDDSE